MATEKGLRLGSEAVLPWIPAFQLSDGYVVPQGFEYFYYRVGEQGMLEVPKDPSESEE